MFLIDPPLKIILKFPLISMEVEACQRGIGSSGSQLKKKKKRKTQMLGISLLSKRILTVHIKKHCSNA